MLDWLETFKKKANILCLNYVSAPGVEMRSSASGFGAWRQDLPPLFINPSTTQPDGKGIIRVQSYTVS